ncbi:MAG: hypothetical protein ACK415_06820 [Thermodesulfovibrionales bacterium]
MYKKILINLLTTTFFFSVVNYLQAQEGFYKKTQEKLYRKENVKKEEARNEVGRAIFSIGFSAPAIGNDPCQGVEKTMGGMKKYTLPGAAELTGLPTKPSVSVGRQGQIMEGETSSYHAENVCYEGYDFQGNKCVEATANPDGTTTFKNTSEDKCVIVMNDKQTLSLAPKSEVTLNTERKDPNPVLEGIRKARSWITDKLPDWTKSSSSPSKSSAVGVRGNCDPEGVAGGCIVNAGSGVVQTTIPEYINTMAEAERKGLAKKLRWTRVNPSPESPGSTEGPPISKTSPGEVTKSGFEKEKGSKVSKGETIINPSESASGGRGRSTDLCGRHLLAPEQAASMGFDPGRITDPANRDWTGRIEQRGTERTLTWSKTAPTASGSVKVEYTYKEGELVAINYEFFDKKGNKIGYATFDGKNRTVEAKRLK